MKYIDLRSDTVTKPSPEMRAAMAEAEVGDDVYGEDPTVNMLQETVASLLGKEDALFTPSGLMANQIAIKAQTNPGDEVIVEAQSHIYNYETAAAAVLSNVLLRPIEGRYGIVTSQQVKSALRLPVYYNPKTTLICLENTHNKAGGTVFPLDVLKDIYSIAQKHDIRVHMDGARLWNASVATGISVKEYARYADTITVCFSKGLGAPIGSALVGTKEIIEKARIYRKMFGGGMRQVGIIAAGALYALKYHRDELAHDHEKIRWLANALQNVKTISIDQNTVQTNILVMEVTKNGITAEEIAQKLKKEGVLLSVMSTTTIRAVAHRDVTMDDVQLAGEIIKKILLE
ncbi:MAG: aminotransferase class I/II-fold pyridoxal phosphate-dependent enzyme [Bacteroidetes bacterium]|nr:aminotransferase class I/II-fold pyridoxal phosphate-dependent enzyme [Bacteroidota bacterium]